MSEDAWIERNKPQNGVSTTRVLVCGGRAFTNRHVVWSFLDAVKAIHGDLTIIEGGARGADESAREWALSREQHLIEVPAKWAEEGRAAGPIRNQRMLDECSPQLAIAFPGGRGTADMVRRLKQAGVPLIEFSSWQLQGEAPSSFHPR